ncbi:hypothetical protein H8959_019230 [Pygathrix nigripes]
MKNVQRNGGGRRGRPRRGQSGIEIPRAKSEGWEGDSPGFLRSDRWRRARGLASAALRAGTQRTWAGRAPSSGSPSTGRPTRGRQRPREGWRRLRQEPGSRGFSSVHLSGGAATVCQAGVTHRANPNTSTAECEPVY